MKTKVLVVGIVFLIVIIVLVGCQEQNQNSRDYITVDEFVLNPSLYIGKNITLRGVYWDGGGFFGSLVVNSEIISWITLDFGDWSNESYFENNTELVNKSLLLKNNKTFDAHLIDKVYY